MLHERTTYVLSWTQTEVDGLRGGPLGSVETGSVWRWSGQAVSVHIAGDAELAPGNDASLDPRDTVHSLRFVLGRSFLRGRLSEGCYIEDPLLERYLVLGIGDSRFVAGLIEMAELSRPLLLFHGHLPPRDTDLRVVDRSDDDSMPLALAHVFAPRSLADERRRMVSGG